MEIYKKTFLRKFKEYTESVLEWDGGIHEVTPSIKRMIYNVERNACPFYFPGIGSLFGHDLCWNVWKDEEMEWTTFGDFGCEWSMCSKYYHKNIIKHKTLKQEILEILESLKE